MTVFQPGSKFIDRRSRRRSEEQVHNLRQSRQTSRWNIFRPSKIFSAGTLSLRTSAVLVDALHRCASMPFEILDLALVLFRSLPCIEGAEVAPPAGFGIDPARVQPILSGFQFLDHCTCVAVRISRELPSRGDEAARANEIPYQALSGVAFAKCGACERFADESAGTLVLTLASRRYRPASQP